MTDSCTRICASCRRELPLESGFEKLEGLGDGTGVAHLCLECAPEHQRYYSKLNPSARNGDGDYTMTVEQALTLAVEVVWYELDYPQQIPPPPDWQRELEQALGILRELRNYAKRAFEKAPPIPERVNGRI